MRRLRGSLSARRSSIPLVVTLLCLLFAADAGAANWSITGFSPNPLKAGCKLTLNGSFGGQGSKVVRGGTRGGTGTLLPIQSWSANAIVVDSTPLAPGTYWVAIYSGGAVPKVKSPKILQLTAGTCRGGTGRRGGSPLLVKPPATAPKQLDSEASQNMVDAFAKATQMQDLKAGAAAAQYGPPTIVKFFHMPPPGTVAGGIPAQVLVPGGKIELGGENFGADPAIVYIKGLPDHDPLVLEVLEWNHKQSQGVVKYSNSALVKIPDDVNAPFYRTNVQLFLKRPIGYPSVARSQPVDKQFEMPGELYQLEARDHGVEANCEMDANQNSCNEINKWSNCTFSSNPPKAILWPIPVPTADNLTFYAHHGNCSATTENDAGTNQHRIHLKNGWVIHSVQHKKGTSSSDDWVGGPVDPSKAEGLST